MFPPTPTSQLLQTDGPTCKMKFQMCHNASLLFCSIYPSHMAVGITETIYVCRVIAAEVLFKIFIAH